MKYVVYIILSMVLTIASIKTSAQSTTLTVEQAIERTLLTYPSVEQAQEAIQLAEYSIKMAQAAFYPILEGTANYTYMEPGVVIKFDDMSFPFEPKNNYGAHVSLSQLIYDFGKSMPAVHRAQLQKEVAQYQYQTIMQNLALQTIQLYYNISVARQSIAIKQEELQNYDEMLRQVIIKNESGSATSYDKLTTQVSRSLVQTQLTGLNSSHLTLQVQFAQLIDSFIDQSVILDTALELSSELNSLEDLLQQAYNQRPEMLIAQKQIAMANYSIEAARRAYFPSLLLDAELGGKNGYPMDIERMKFFWNAGVTLSVPIFDGNRRKQQLSMAKSDYNSAQFQMLRIKKEITGQVSQLYFQLQANLEKVKELQLQLELAQEAYSQAEVNYEAGAITNLERITSATNLSNSKLMLLQAMMNSVINRYQLDVSIGRNIWK